MKYFHKILFFLIGILTLNSLSGQSASVESDNLRVLIEQGENLFPEYTLEAKNLFDTAFQSVDSPDEISKEVLWYQVLPVGSKIWNNPDLNTNPLVTTTQEVLLPVYRFFPVPTVVGQDSWEINEYAYAMESSLRNIPVWISAEENPPPLGRVLFIPYQQYSGNPIDYGKELMLLEESFDFLPKGLVSPDEVELVSSQWNVTLVRDFGVYNSVDGGALVEVKIQNKTTGNEYFGWVSWEQVGIFQANWGPGEIYSGRVTSPAEVESPEPSLENFRFNENLNNYTFMEFGPRNLIHFPMLRERLYYRYEGRSRAISDKPSYGSRYDLSFLPNPWQGTYPLLEHKLLDFSKPDKYYFSDYTKGISAFMISYLYALNEEGDNLGQVFSYNSEDDWEAGYMRTNLIFSADGQELTLESTRTVYTGRDRNEIINETQTFQFDGRRYLDNEGNPTRYKLPLWFWDGP